jgi:predicted ATPase
VLLVLDNFEHIVSEGTPIVRTLLERLPGVTCLVTSRQRLLLAGEREIVLEPLETPEGHEPPQELVELASVRFFVDRAQAVRPHFQVTKANAREVALLLRRLEGIPLAIALAAGHAQVLSPGQILARLEAGASELANRQRDAPSRHRTLRAAIDWSFELLAPELRRFFASLQVFRGGFTLEAAEDIGQDALATDALAALRERSGCSRCCASSRASSFRTTSRTSCRAATRSTSLRSPPECAPRSAGWTLAPRSPASRSSTRT